MTRPGGLLVILAALGNWEWGPLRHAWVFLGVALVLAAASLLISRYYAQHYGRVTLSRAQRRRAAAAVIVGAPLMFVVALLLRSRVGWSLDLPVNAIRDLEEAGLVEIAKRFIRKKPNTNVALTAVGRQRIANHWSQLERLKRLSEAPLSEAAADA